MYGFTMTKLRHKSSSFVVVRCCRFLSFVFVVHRRRSSSFVVVHRRRSSSFVVVRCCAFVVVCHRLSSFRVNSPHLSLSSVSPSLTPKTCQTSLYIHTKHAPTHTYTHARTHPHTRARAHTHTHGVRDVVSPYSGDMPRSLPVFTYRPFKFQRMSVRAALASKCHRSA